MTHFLKKITGLFFCFLFLISPSFVSADLLLDLQAQIQALQAQINLLLSQQNTGSNPTAATDPVVSGTNPSCPTLSITMERGARDATTMGEVSKLQTFLASRYKLNTADFVTGYFGPLTHAFVMKFQEENNLPAVGIAGSLTRAQIARVCATAPAIAKPIVGLYVSPAVVSSGESATVSWNVQNAQRCVLKYGTKENIVALSGSQIVTPTQTTTYTLWCANDPGTGKDGPSASANVEVKVGSGSTQSSIRVLTPNGGESIDPAKPLNIKIAIEGLKTLSIALYKNDQWYRWLSRDMLTIGQPHSFEWIHTEPNLAGTAPELAETSAVAFKIYATGEKNDGGYVDDKSDTAFRFLRATTTSVAFSIGISTSSAVSGESVSLTWGAHTGTQTKDWIIIAPTGAQYTSVNWKSDASKNSWSFTNGSAEGPITLKVPTTPGIYDVIYYRDSTFTEATRRVGALKVSAPPVTISPIPTPTPTPVVPQYLYALKHISTQCASTGGMVRTLPNGAVLCEYTGSACPSGWTRFQNAGSTNTKTCGSSQAQCPAGCTTGRHAWSDVAAETCSYTSRILRQGQQGENSYCQNSTVVSCTATTATVGCY